jgi:hypothetical protein
MDRAREDDFVKCGDAEPAPPGIAVDVLPVASWGTGHGNNRRKHMAEPTT